DMNLAMALAEAGSSVENFGFTRPILVVRNALTNPVVFKFDVEDALVNAKPWPRLVPGDVVIAQSSLYADIERAIGIARQASETISRPVDTFGSD
ncbi:MAG: hypothetical protein KDB07_13785, partial [Planctomycetes bacterium]|nr:hypothetical protein [Planctomycetota bacterium]